MRPNLKKPAAVAPAQRGTLARGGAYGSYKVPLRATFNFTSTQVYIFVTVTVVDRTKRRRPDVKRRILAGLHVRARCTKIVLKTGPSFQGIKPAMMVLCDLSDARPHEW